MSTKKELSEWKYRIEVAKEKIKPLLEDLETYQRYYRSDQWQDMNVSKRFNDQVVDNIIFSNIRAMIPRVCARNPKFYIKPMKKPYDGENGRVDTVGQAMFMEFLLNYYFRTLKVKREARKCLYDAYLGHMALMEIGYTLRTEKIMEKNKKGQLIEIDELIKEDSLFVKRRSMKDFLRDPEGSDHLLNDDRWIALRWVKPLEDIKGNKNFTNTSGLKTNYRVGVDDDVYKQMTHDSKVEADSVWGRVEGWTVWDKKKRRRMDIVLEHDKFLSDTPWPEWTKNIDGFPVEVLYINENPDQPNALSDIQVYRKAQDEINMIGSMQISHLKKISERRYVANEGAIEEEELEKLLVGGDGVCALVKGNPSDKLIPLKDVGISQDIYAVQRSKKQEIAMMAGVSAQEKAQTSKLETAEESKVISQSSDTLRGDQRGLFEDFLVRVGIKMAAVLQATMKDETIPLQSNEFGEVRKFITRDNPALQDTQKNLISKLDKIVGEDGSVTLNPWMTLTKADVQGQYDFEIEAGSTAPVNQMDKKQDAIMLANQLAGNPHVNEREGILMILEAFDVKDLDRILKPEEQVAQEMQAQQEFQMQLASMEPQADMQKKQMDVQKALMTTQMKTESDQKIAELEQGSETGRNTDKVMGDIAKTAMTNKEEKKEGSKE